MPQQLLTIKKNIQIAEQTYMMELEGDTSTIMNPGQFINIQISGCFLRRPMSIAKWDENSLTIMYRIVGSGTKRLSEYTYDTELDCLVGLGNGFDISKAVDKRVLFIGGGLGTAPLIGLARELKKNSEKIDAVIGFGEKKYIIGEKELNNYCNNVSVVTLDGSYGIKGLPTDIVDVSKYDYYFTCGPENMLKAVHKLNIAGQLSFEARMGCGFGACMGCSCRTLSGYKRICVEGPVMYSSEVSFDD